MNTVLSLRAILDSLVFGMSNIPGFSALSIPVFMSNYLFDLFSQFFAVLVIFALAIMSFDGLRRGKQSLREDLINLSLVIITVFVILNFKDESVTYGGTPSYGIVTLYAGLLEKGEDIADALTYALLYNTPTENQYSPNNKRPNASTPLKGIVGNSFFSVLFSNGEINKKALNDYLNEREKFIESQHSLLKVLFSQDSINTVMKNVFNFVKAPYVAAKAKKKRQGYVYGSGVMNIETTQLVRFYDKATDMGIPFDRTEQVIYTVTDGQTPDNSCMLISYYLPEQVENGNKIVIDFSNAGKVKNLINNLLSMKFSFILPDCKTVKSVEGPKELTYPFVLKDTLSSLHYFWDKIYKNMDAFYKNQNLKKMFIPDNEAKQWPVFLKELKTIADFYEEAAKLVENNFPVDAENKKEYALVFKNNKYLFFKQINRVKDSLAGILQKKRQIIVNTTKRGSDAQTYFFNQMNNLMGSYVKAIQTAFESAKLFAPKIFLNGQYGLNSGKVPESFSSAYRIASITATPYISLGTAVSLNFAKNNLVAFYNAVATAVDKIYNRIKGSFSYVFGANPDLGVTNVKDLLNKNNNLNSNKGESLNSLVKENYGYDGRVDLIYPWVRLPVSVNKEEFEQFLEDSKKAYQQRAISWVDLGYYFSALKAFTSDFIVFSTYALANGVFSKSSSITGESVEKAINLAAQYVNLYNRNYSDAAKTRIISDTIANTMTAISAIKAAAGSSLISSLTLGFLKYVKGGWIGLIIGAVVIFFKIMFFAAKIGATFLFYLLAVTLVLKFILVMLPALFWMIAVLNWFFKSALMIVMLPINVFLMFFKSRRQVFFQALWKLLAQMLTPVALVATFFVVIVFAVEVNLLIDVFIPFLNDNVIAYLFSDANIRSFIAQLAQREYSQAKELFHNGHWFLGALQYIKTFFVYHVAKAGAAVSNFFGATKGIVSILGIILFIIKTLIVFVVDFHLYMLFFKADDYIRETIGETFGVMTGMEGSIERLSGKFGVNRIT